MRSFVVGKLLAGLTVSLALVACGSNVAGTIASPPVQTAPTTLTGNWLLTGSRVPAVYPVISTTLYVQGSTIVGEATVYTQCSGGGLISSSTSALALTGTVANDGTYQASSGTVGAPTAGTTSLTLTGNSPSSAAPSIWIGNYSLAVTAGSVLGTCGLAQNANISATAIAPIAGTYVGVATGPGGSVGPFGAAAALSVQITQGTPTLITRAGKNTYPIPLTASLTISNSACTFSGSTTAVAAPSTVAGDRFTLLFATAGAHGEGALNGTLDDASATSFSADLTSVAVDQGCPGIALYHFTRK